MLLISYCTHLSIKGPWRVSPTRTKADIKCAHRGKERGKRQTSREAQRGLQRHEERRSYRRNEMQDRHSLNCFILKSVLSCLENMFLSGYNWLDMDPIKHEGIKYVSVCVQRWVLSGGGGYRCCDLEKSMCEPLYKDAKWRPSH